jgi:hypothetical protein
MRRRDFLKGLAAVSAGAVVGVAGAAVARTKETARKIRARWRAESQKDRHAYHSLDAERELVDAMAKDIAKEIDEEIVRDAIGKRPLLDRMKAWLRWTR